MPAVIGSVVDAAAQNTGAPVLGYPAQARLVGMGATGVADNTDPSTIYYNPANAVAAPRAYVTGSRMNWPDDWFVDDLWAGRANAGFAWQGDGASPLSWGADFSMARLDYGESIATLPDGTPLGTFHAFEQMASLALAVAIPSGGKFEFRGGVAAKRWWAEYGRAEFAEPGEEVNPDAYAFDAGITGAWRTTVDGWSVNPALALAIVDAGPDYDVSEGEDPLPTRLNFGASVHIESPLHRLGDAHVPLVAATANVDATEPSEGDFAWALGTEMAVAQILFLRSGSRIVHEDDDEDPIFSAWGVGLGVPISSFRLRIDYTKGDYYFGTTTEHVGAMLAWVF